MKQLCLIGTVGNNLAVVQIPTDWSVEEAKKMLEMSLKMFNKCKKDYCGEFVNVSSEEELKEMFPTPTSRLIVLCNNIMKEVGKPNETTGLVWQFNVMSYLSSHPDSAKELANAFRNPTKEEKEYINANYLEFLQKLTNSLYC